MLYKKTVEDIFKAVIAELNQVSKTHTDLEDLWVDLQGNCNVDLRTFALCSTYNNNNDRDLEVQLMDCLREILPKHSKDINIVQMLGGGEKAHWGCIIELKSKVNKTTNIKKFSGLITKYKTELNEFNNNVLMRIKNQKSKTKGCSSCGSSVNKDFFKSHKCPVCNAPMYTTTDQKRVDNLNLRIQSNQKELRTFS